MYHFTSAAFMTPVKPQDSFAASSLSSGAALPAAGYGIMEEPRLPRSCLKIRPPKRRHAVSGRKGGRKNKELILFIIAEDLSLRKGKKESQKEIFP